MFPEYELFPVTVTYKLTQEYTLLEQILIVLDPAAKPYKLMLLPECSCCCFNLR